MPDLTIIAVHGNGGGGFRFERMQPYLTDDVKFDAPTLPGFADQPADPTLKTLRDYADYLHGLVKRETRPVVLLGTGIGGSIVLEYIQHHAASIDGIILHAPVGARLDTRRFPALMSVPGAKAFGQWLFSTPLTRPLFKRLLFMDFRAIPQDFLNRFFREYGQCSVFGQMFNIIDAAWFADLEPVEVPAALLWGAEERVLSTDHIDDYKTLLPNNIVRIVPGWDHFPMIEQPQAYTHEVIALAQELLGET